LNSWLHQLHGQTTQGELLDLVALLNADPQVHGILVQLPLPKQIDEAAIISAVSPLKDVDGFGPENLGLLTTGHPRYLPCTPAGIQQLLMRNGYSPEGKHVVIVGRSNIVGKPLALILVQKARGADATVTICHSRTRNLRDVTCQADILVMAIGQPNFLKADMVRSGVVAAAISPVPGGVGPMTITMLLHNTLQAAKAQAGRSG
jgi:methylenetetrahydrofolate dehydrogenase (NADP+)/methenyltetrahydrofolate cyclohydrolase